MIELNEIEQFFASYAAAWGENDSALIAMHWDTADPEPFYKAEEIPNYFHRFDDIKNYWRNNERAHEKIQLKFTNTATKELGHDQAIAFVHMRWDIKFAPPSAAEGPAAQHAGKAMGGENHVLAMLRRTTAGLRLIGWSETPDAPISYMRRLYEWAADPAVL